MDNLTHTLVSVAAADFVSRVGRKDASQLNGYRPLMAASLIAGNFPDTDLVLQLLDSSRLGYMLNHRGFTHTIVGLIPQAIVIFLLFCFVSSTIKASRELKYRLAAVVGFGFAAHLGLDALNVYGVHPFFPLDNRWFYGDAVYIIEPLLWVFLIPLVWHISKQSWPKFAVLGVALAAGIGGVLFEVLAPVSVALMLAAGTAVYFLYRRFSVAIRGGVALMLTSFMLIMFYTVGGQVRASIERLHASSEFDLKDVILSPFPGNPLCWSFITIEQSPTEYRAQLGEWGWISCPTWIKAGGVPLGPPDPVVFKSDPRLVVRGEYRTSLADLLRDREQNCKIAGWFKFARAPHRHQNIFNDLRYSTKAKDNFSSLDLEKDAVGDPICPPLPAPWIPPRFE